MLELVLALSLLLHLFMFCWSPWCDHVSPFLPPLPSGLLKSGFLRWTTHTLVTSVATHCTHLLLSVLFSPPPYLHISCCLLYSVTSFMCVSFVKFSVMTFHNCLLSHSRLLLNDLLKISQPWILKEHLEAFNTLIWRCKSDKQNVLMQLGGIYMEYTASWHCYLNYIREEEFIS